MKFLRFPNLSKFLFFFILFLIVALPVLAITIPNPIQADTIAELIKDIADLIFWVAIAVVPLMVIISGIMFIFAGGDPNKISQARNLLFWAGIGLAILLLARAISSVVETFIEG